MDGKNIIVNEIRYTGIGSFQTGSEIIEELSGLYGRFDRIRIPAGGNLMFETVGEGGSPGL